MQPTKEVRERSIDVSNWVVAQKEENELQIWLLWDPMVSQAIIGALLVLSSANMASPVGEDKHQEREESNDQVQVSYRGDEEGMQHI